MNTGDADVVKKFIFRYRSVPSMNGNRNIFIRITTKNNINNSSSEITFGTMSALFDLTKREIRDGYRLIKFLQRCLYERNIKCLFYKGIFLDYRNPLFQNAT